MAHSPLRSPDHLEASFQREIDRSMHRTLLHGVGPFGLFFLALVIPHFLFNRSGIALGMALASTLTGGVLLALVPVLRRVSVPKSSLHPLATIVILFVAANPMLHQALSGNSFHASTLMLVLVASGYLILNTRWYLGCGLLLLLGWLALSISKGFGRMDLHFLIGLISAYFMGYMLNRTSLAFIWEGVRRRERLREALRRVDTLKGLIPICASCKKVRDDQGFWNQVEVYVQAHSEAEFTHGICPECASKMKAEWNASLNR